MEAPDKKEWQRMSAKERGYYVRGLQLGMEAVAMSILGEAQGAALMDQMRAQLKAQYPAAAQVVGAAGVPKKKRPVRRKAAKG